MIQRPHNWDLIRLRVALVILAPALFKGGFGAAERVHSAHLLLHTEAAEEGAAFTRISPGGS